MAGCSHNGYGKFQFRDRTQAAHRVSWLILKGEIPDGMMVLHECDNRRCVNPTHLRLGTQQDNVNDMVRRDRHSAGDRHYARRSPELVVRGEAHGNSKLTEDSVREIRRTFVIGESSYTQYAKQYGVTKSTISNVVSGKIWRSVKNTDIDRGPKADYGFVQVK